MTEAGPVLSMCLSFAKHPTPVKPGSCGTVVRNAEMKIVDTDSGASLTYNQSGEICIRGKQIMKGMTMSPTLHLLLVHVSGLVGLLIEDNDTILVGSFVHDRLFQQPGCHKLYY